MRRIAASLVLLAVMAGFTPPPVHADPAELAKLIAIYNEVTRLRDEVLYTYQQMLILKKQAQYYADMSQYLFRPRWNHGWELLAGTHCFAAPWELVFTRGMQVDQALNTLRSALDWNCADASAFPPDIRHLADITVLLDNITRHNMRDAGEARRDSVDAQYPIEALLSAAADTSEGAGRSLTAKLQIAAGAATTSTALVHSQQGLIGEQLELDSMLATLERNDLAGDVGSEHQRQKTHAGTFENIQPR
jgi:hypothetical protein